MAKTKKPVKRATAKKPTKRSTAKKPATRKKRAKDGPRYEVCRKPLAALTRLEARLAEASDHETLWQLAGELDKCGGTIALTIARVVNRPGPEQEMHDLIDLMNRAGACSADAAERAARKCVEIGSVKQAAFYLFEALQKTNDWEVIARLATALVALLEPYTQPKAAELRELAIARARPLEGDAFMAAQRTFTQGVYHLKDRIDWNALPDSFPRG